MRFRSQLLSVYYQDVSEEEKGTAYCSDIPSVLETDSQSGLTGTVNRAISWRNGHRLEFVHRLPFNL